eukprot:366360-Chlamydomonas_euryale.AAC.17
MRLTSVIPDKRQPHAASRPPTCPPPNASRQTVFASNARCQPLSLLKHTPQTARSPPFRRRFKWTPIPPPLPSDASYQPLPTK